MDLDWTWIIALVSHADADILNNLHWWVMISRNWKQWNWNEQNKQVNRNLLLSEWIKLDTRIELEHLRMSHKVDGESLDSYKEFERRERVCVCVCVFFYLCCFKICCLWYKAKEYPFIEYNIELIVDTSAVKIEW